MAFTGYGFRLRAFEPGGELLGNIPQPLKVTFTTFESDTSALQVTYPKDSPGLEYFYAKKEIVVDASFGGVEWQEGYDSRFVPVTYEDDVLDENHVVVFTCVGLSFLLTKAIIGAQSEEEFKTDIGQARSEEKAARTKVENLSVPIRHHVKTAPGFKAAWLDLPILFEVSTPSSYGPTGQVWINTTGQRRAHWRMADNKGWNLLEAASNTDITNVYNAHLEYEVAQENLKAVQSRDRISVRSFDKGHAGYILSRLWDDTKLRPGRLGVLEKTFTDTHDSYGNPWPTVNSPTEVKAGTTYEALLQSFVDMGQVAFRFHERKLFLTTADRGFGEDRSEYTVLRYGHNISEAPDRATIKDMAHSVTFIGDEGLVYTLDNEQAATPWGRWESSVLQSNVADKATGILYSRKALETATGERIERTRELHFNNDGPFPHTHYLVGDWISGPMSDGRMEKQRVNALTITLDVQNEKFEGNVVLNDRFIERDIRNARKTNMLSSGVSAVSGLGGTPSKQPSVDLREPQAPRYLQGGGESFLSQDRGYETVFVIDWWWSGKATDGTEMSARLDTYDVQYRLHQDGSSASPTGNAQAWRSAGTVDVINRSAVVGPLATYYPGTANAASYEFRVRARSKAPVVSEWSQSITLTCPEDDTAPTKPTAPVADGSTPIIQLTWDGRNVEGGAMPYDLKHVIIEQSTDNGATWSAEGMPLFYGPDTQPLASTVNQKGVQFIYRLKAVDHTGNESEYSDPSAPVSITMIVDTAQIEKALADNTIALKVTRDKLSAEGVMDEVVAQAFYGDIANFIQINTDQIVANAVTAGKISSLAVETDKLAANAVTAGKADITSLKAAIVTADVFNGREMNGNTITGGLFQTQKEANRGIKIDSTGLKMWAPTGGEPTVDMDTATGSAVLTGRLRTGKDGEPGIIVSNASSGWNGTDQGVWFTRNGIAYGWGSPGDTSAPDPVAGVFTLGNTTSEPLRLRGHGGSGVVAYDMLTLTAVKNPMGYPEIYAGQNLRIRTSGHMTLQPSNDMNISAGAGNVIRFLTGAQSYAQESPLGANLRIGDGGFIYKSTSAEKYKTNIQPYEVDEEVLNLPLLKWQSKAAVEKYERLKDAPRPFTEQDQLDWELADLAWGIGTTSEQALLHGAGDLVSYQNGEVDGFQYDRFAFLLLPFVRELYGWYKENRDYIAAMRTTN